MPVMATDATEQSEDKDILVSRLFRIRHHQEDRMD